MNDESKSDQSDDPLESLFAGVESRPKPSKAARERAFEAVTEEWEAIQKRRVTIYRFVPLAVAATLLLGVVGLVMTLQPVSTQLTLQLAQGHIHVDTVVHRATQQPIQLELDAGSTIKAVESTRWVAANGADVRVDKGAEFAWLSHDKLSLEKGDIYVITDGLTPFVVETVHGVITDIGTEFLITSDDEALLVAVREGRIELATASEVRQTAPVEQGQSNVIEFAGGSIVERTEFASHERWNWVHITSKGYTSENPVAMLQAITRDLGKQLQFEPGVEERLRREELHGDYRGMTPWAALEQVTRVTDIRWGEANGIVTISLNH